MAASHNDHAARIAIFFRGLNANALISSGFAPLRNLRTMRSAPSAQSSTFWRDLFGVAEDRLWRRGHGRSIRTDGSATTRAGTSRGASTGVHVSAPSSADAADVALCCATRARRAAAAGVLARVRRTSDRCSVIGPRRTTTSTRTPGVPDDVEQVDPVRLTLLRDRDERRGLGGVRDSRGARRGRRGVAVWGAAGEAERPWVPAAARRRGPHRVGRRPRDIGAAGRPRRARPRCRRPSSDRPPRRTPIRLARLARAGRCRDDQRRRRCASPHGSGSSPTSPSWRSGAVSDRSGVNRRA